MSDSELMKNDLRLSFNKDALSQRPTTNASSRKAVYSQDGRRQCIFRRSQKAARQLMDGSTDLVFWCSLIYFSTKYILNIKEYDHLKSLLNISTLKSSRLNGGRFFDFLFTF